MKSKTLRPLGVLFAGITAIAFSPAVLAADITWDGGGDGTDLGAAANWSGDVAPNGAANDVMVWNGSVAGAISLDYTTASTLGASAGVGFSRTSGQTAALTIDGSLASGLRLGAAGVNIASGSGAFTLGNGSGTFNFTVANTNVSLTNNSSNAATINSDVTMANSAAGFTALQFGGGGDWAVNAAIASINGGRFNILKTGTGELTLAGGGNLRGGATINGGTGYSAVLKEGTTRITSGTYANNASEFVVGGGDATGVDTELIMDGGSLTGIGWLSVGRGNNGAGGASDVTLNNNASISSTNMSLGFNPGTGAPTGTVTLNGTSSLTVASGGNIGESTGSNMTMTLNDSATFTSSAGIVEVGQNSGTGTININESSTVTVASMRIGRGNNATASAKGYVNVTGGTLNSEGDLVLAYAGSTANGNVGKLTINSGAVNVGSTAKRWMIINQYDTAHGELEVNGGNLNLNAGTDLRFSTGNSGALGTSVVNLNDGAITSYSDNKTTANGAGVVDLQTSGGADSNNTFNLNGGTLSIRAVITSNDSGTAAFNFNGGTLKATGNDANLINLGGANQKTNVLAGGAVIDSNGFDVTIVDGLLSSGGDGGLTKNGAGTLTVAGTSTYDGATTVAAGTLFVSGALGDSAVTVEDGATIAGAGSIGGSLHLAAGSTLDVTDGTLTVTGPVSFGSFDFGDLVGFDVHTADVGTFTLMDGSNIDFSNVAHYGLENALDLGGGKAAYFQSGSLQVVVVPEPGAALLGGLGMLGLLRRRRG